MKFDCGSSTKKSDSRLTWHPWFAWYLVRISDNDCRWLETVDRRGNMEYYYGGDNYWKYEYRPLDKIV
jgi:hypothetical protein